MSDTLMSDNKNHQSKHQLSFCFLRINYTKGIWKVNGSGKWKTKLLDPSLGSHPTPHPTPHPLGHTPPPPSISVVVVISTDVSGWASYFLHLLYNNVRKWNSVVQMCCTYSPETTETLRRRRKHSRLNYCFSTHGGSSAAFTILITDPGIVICIIAFVPSCSSWKGSGLWTSPPPPPPRSPSLLSVYI